MTPCSACHRHLRDAERTCPFCGASRRSRVRRAAFAAGVASAALSLSACYGAPPRRWEDEVAPVTTNGSPTTSPDDADASGR